MAWFNAQLGAFVLALAGVIGATVAVCLGHIDQATYIALVGPILGVGVGAGVHANGVQTAAPTIVTAAPPPPTTV